MSKSKIKIKIKNGKLRLFSVNASTGEWAFISEQMTERM